MTETDIQIDLCDRLGQPSTSSSRVSPILEKLSEHSRYEERNHCSRSAGGKDEITDCDKFAVRLGLSNCDGAGASCVPVHLQNLTSLWHNNPTKCRAGKALFRKPFPACH
jgi:hypothetical protein